MIKIIILEFVLILKSYKMYVLIALKHAQAYLIAARYWKCIIFPNNAKFYQFIIHHNRWQFYFSKIIINLCYNSTQFPPSPI